MSTLLSPTPEATTEVTPTPEATPALEASPESRVYEGGYQDVESLEKGYKELRTAFSKKAGVPAMGEGADEEAIAAFRVANDIPSDATGYDIKLPEIEGVEFPDGALAQYQEMASGLNLTPSQAQILADKHVAMIAEESKQAQAQFEQANEQAVNDLKQEWGIKFDANLEQAKNTFQHFTAEAGLTEEQTSALSNDPAFAKIMQAVGSKMGESTFVKGGVTNPIIGNQQEAMNILNDANHPDHSAFNNPNDPRHQQVVDRVAIMLKK